MTFPRSSLVDPGRAGAFHLVSRCVRRAFLCGDAAEHRRQWVTDAIRLQSTAFCIDVLAYAVMANHLHVVVTTQPDRAAALTPLAVAERWAVLFPARDDDGNPVPPSLPDLQARAADAAWVDERRRRLSSLSWYMKLLKERLARRANAEDKCTGHFWEGRFTSVPLLDQAAVTACMAYVDLNPIRAKLADRPETSDFTSIQARISDRQAERKALALADVLPDTAPTMVPTLAAGSAAGWLAPLRRCVPYSEATAKLSPGPLSLDDYLTLVDETGRYIRSGKRGAIPQHLAPILARLDLDLATWLEAMLSPGRFLGGAIGSAAARAAEALRRGVKWVVDRAKIHKPPDAA
jgi:REP element-mobilizing transposase RayT